MHSKPAVAVESELFLGALVDPLTFAHRQRRTCRKYRYRGFGGL